MTTIDHSDTANFYELVHRLATEPTEDDDERRERPRRRYRRVQLLAPLAADVEFPPRSDFHAVLCRDLSEQGFSYICSQAPTTQRVVLVLGDAEDCTYLLARVAHCSARGSQFLVGCQFLGRVAPPPEPEPARPTGAASTATAPAAAADGSTPAASASDAPTATVPAAASVAASIADAAWADEPPPDEPSAD